MILSLSLELFNRHPSEMQLTLTEWLELRAYTKIRREEQEKAAKGIG